ncbi:MAG TPA: hypothetical protein VMS40_00520, partial [Vicinamibacterales bacterium]|nr:hypothetical protein [Vicinamibacterales bacterium]
SIFECSKPTVSHDDRAALISAQRQRQQQRMARRDPMDAILSRLKRAGNSSLGSETQGRTSFFQAPLRIW